MKLNPLLALIEPLEKLIIEHGSAVVLREHLALLKTQASILETENEQLRREVKDLRLEMDKCENLNKELRQQLAKHSIPPASASSEPGPDGYHAKRRKLL